MEGDSQFSLTDIFRGIDKATSGFADEVEPEEKGKE